MTLWIAVVATGLGCYGLKLAGLAAAVVALLLRAPFLVVLLVAAVVTAGLRYLGG